MADESIYDELKKEGLSRRGFIKFCGTMAGAMGMVRLPTFEDGHLPIWQEGTNPYN
jgi:hypothetical protein